MRVRVHILTRMPTPADDTKPPRWATSVTRDPALRPLLDAHPDYPGPVAILDAADRAWLRARGVDVPDRAPAVPLHERAREARRRKAAEGAAPAKGGGKKKRAARKASK